MTQIYGNAFHVDAGRCFRFVYEESTSRPTFCLGPVVTRGWWQDGAGYWWAVDACAEHASHLSQARPRPGARFGHQRPPFPVRRKPSTGGPKSETAELAA